MAFDSPLSGPALYQVVGKVQEDEEEEGCGEEPEPSQSQNPEEGPVRPPLEPRRPHLSPAEGEVSEVPADSAGESGEGPEGISPMDLEGLEALIAPSRRRLPGRCRVRMGASLLLRPGWWRGAPSSNFRQPQDFGPPRSRRCRLNSEDLLYGADEGRGSGTGPL